MILLLSSKFKLFLKFLNNMIIKKPIENSKPATANKKNVKEYNVMSSLFDPTIKLIMYNVIQMTSEYKKIFKKFEGLNNIINISVQNTRFQNINHSCIKIFYNSI